MKDKNNQAILERKILRRVFGTKRSYPTEVYAIRPNNSKKHIFGEDDIVETFEGKNISCLEIKSGNQKVRDHHFDHDWTGRSGDGRMN